MPPKLVQVSTFCSSQIFIHISLKCAQVSAVNESIMCHSVVCNPMKIFMTVYNFKTPLRAPTPKMLMLDFWCLCMFNHLTNVCLVNNSEKSWHYYYFCGFIWISLQHLCSKESYTHFVNLSLLIWTQCSPISQHIVKKWHEVLFNLFFLLVNYLFWISLHCHFPKMPIEAAESLKQSFNHSATVANVERRVSVTLQTCQFSCATGHEVHYQKPKKSCLLSSASAIFAALQRKHTYAILLSWGNLLSCYLSSVVMLFHCWKY